ncbi:MAG: T9SS type A sorting domain-containing protein [Bacteroidia bacterium]
MKNHFLPAIIFLLFCNHAFAQNQLIKQWDYRFGGSSEDHVTISKQTADGGYILGGYSDSPSDGDKTQDAWNNLEDYWIVKIDLAGNKQWDRRFGGTSLERLYALEQTSDGGYILGGFSRSEMSGDKSQNTWGGIGDGDYWIVKTDSLGNKLWDRDYGGAEDDYLTALVPTNDGGYILGGWSRSGIGGDKSEDLWGVPIDNDYWIVKIDSVGSKQWDKDFGGTNVDYLAALQQTSDGGYIFGGYSGSGISGNKTTPNQGLFDYWIVKTDSSGNIQWDMDYGGFNSDDLFSMQQTKDGGYILGGTSESDVGGDKTQANWGGSQDYWIVKIDSFGAKEWDKDFGSYNYDYDLRSVSATTDGGYLIQGSSQGTSGGDKSENNLGPSQSWILKIDSTGIKQWDKTLLTDGFDLYGFAMQTSDGCYLFANSSNGGLAGEKSQTSRGFYDYWIVKFCDTTFMGQSPLAMLSSSDTAFCEKQCINFFDVSTNNPTSWQWFFPGSDSLTSTLQNPTNICYNSYGSYDVTLITCNAFGCDTLLLTNYISCYQNPVDSIYQSNDTLFSLPGYSYQWYEVTNGIIAGATNQFFIPQQAGSYYCVVSDSIGCAGSSSTIIITATTQISNFNFPISIVPNPFNDNITITFQNQNIHKASFTIKNVLGQNVFSKIYPPSGVRGSYAASSLEIDLSFLPKGIYFLDLMMDDTGCVRKIVKD